MALNLNQTGHFVIFVYFMIFGLAFLGSSTDYLDQLNQFDLTQACPLLSVDNIFNSTDPVKNVHDLSSESCVVHLDTWKGLAITGIVYGVTCLVAAIFQLWRAYWVGTTIVKMRPPGVPWQQSFSAMLDETIIDQIFFQLGSLDQNEPSERSFLSTCRNKMGAAFLFIAMTTMWLASLVVPTYLAVQLYRTEAIWIKRRGQTVIFPPPLVLAVVCGFHFVTALATLKTIWMNQQKSVDNHWPLDPYDPWSILGGRGVGSRGDTVSI